MLITCKCLNVSICINGSNISEIDVAQLGLSSTELNDAFFKEDVGKVEVDRISKEQASLIHLRNAGTWIIHQCLNCSMNTHAIHREKGASYVIVNKRLMSDAKEIIAAKNSDKYSTVFRIVVDGSEEPVPASIQSPSKFSGSRGTQHTALQQQLAEAIQRETLLTEERVRVYSEQEYAALERFREQANHEHRILSRLLYKSEDMSGDSSAKVISASGFPPKPLILSPNKPPVNPAARLPPLPVANAAAVAQNPPSPGSNPQRTGVGLVSPKRTPLSAVNVGPQKVQGGGETPGIGSRLNAQLQQVQKLGPKVAGGVGGAPRSVARRLPLSAASNRRSTPSDSYDSEGLFDLEGMDENPGEAFQSGEESDTDVSDSGSHDEGIHIPRQRVVPQVAKSVPMNVPMYVPNNRGGDESEEDRPVQDPMDIAASIKALAKSLHGDANVFGDLPRPRFSTQL
ncbi:uncharacterized protein LOC124162890 isoform X2 [Ischnura elegans]|uniref:uncharacterized protein LOC124162890 isoform X2 n=1 Tax=Ischnura elegans TaxID=197161 RepID=UPI001ED8B482|nr:uncharacterized protein LOC124162890 isoform X2 [Ischnura elegans]